MIYNWYPTGQQAEALEEGRMKEVAAGAKTVGIIKRNGKISAFAAHCPHAGAPMCEGWVDARGRIVCPVHSYRFDPFTGYNSSGEGYKLRIYPVEIREDIVYVGLTEE